MSLIRPHTASWFAVSKQIHMLTQQRWCENLAQQIVLLNVMLRWNYMHNTTSYDLKLYDIWYWKKLKLQKAQSSGEASQKFPLILRNPRVHSATSIQSMPPPSHFWKIHFNISLPSTLRSSIKSLSNRCPTKTLQAPLLSFIRATCPARLILFYLITRKVFGEKYKL